MRVLVVAESEGQIISSAHRVLEAQGVKISRLALAPVRRQSGSQFTRKLRRYVFDNEVLDAIRNAVSTFQPNLIHIGTGRASALAVLTAMKGNRTTPLIFDHGAIGGLNVLNPIDHRIFFNRRISKVVVPSLAVINHWMGNMALARLISPERCDVLYHPVTFPDASDIAPRDTVRARFGLAPDDFVIGTVCTIRPIKNLPFVAGVVRDVGQNAQLVVVGSPNDKSEVCRIKDAGGDKVRLVGEIPNAKTIMSAFDVFVTPTHLPGESFGLAPAEAMAAGVPVVTMNIGGTAEIIEHGVSGFALSAAPADWRQTIRMLKSDPEQRARLGAAAQARVATRFSSERIALDCRDLYQRTIAAAS
jgi:glycosyltransferase involved in cell wall biosynthesis